MAGGTRRQLKVSIQVHHPRVSSRAPNPKSLILSPQSQVQGPEFPRQILHVDMDAFFVSVEELENPSLKGKAVVVGADPDGRGVVAAASYEARKFGVHSAMPVRTAKQLCPHAIFLRGQHRKYSDYSHQLCQIFGEFTPVVEMVSIDEAYLDLTGCERLHGSSFLAADKLIRTVKDAYRPQLLCRTFNLPPGFQDRLRSSQTARPALHFSGL